MNYLFDTNAVIYFLDGTGKFPEMTVNDQIFISCITKIELLSGNISADEESRIQAFIDNVNNLLIDRPIIDRPIIERTINLRKNFKLNVPDAIIMASAMEFDSTIITADKEVINKLKNYPIHNPVV